MVKLRAKLDADSLINETCNMRSSDFKTMSKLLTTWESKMTDGLLSKGAKKHEETNL